MDTKRVLKVIVISVLIVITAGLSDDEIVQAACAGVGSTSGFISAVRRLCLAKGESCDTICRNAACSMRTIYGNQGSTAGTCFETFHLYNKRNTLKWGKATIAMVRYGTNGCKHTDGCGPNFCCCRA